MWWSPTPCKTVDNISVLYYTYYLPYSLQEVLREKEMALIATSMISAMTDKEFFHYTYYVQSALGSFRKNALS